MFRVFPKKVLVQFIDGESKRRIAAMDMPVEQLPDTFAANTELNFGSERYRVVHADPKTKAEFSKTKRLIVVLRHVEKADSTSGESE